MKVFDPWRDTINLLSGGKPHRTPRPGERFDVPEHSRRSIRLRDHLRLCLNHFRGDALKIEDCSSEGEVYAQPTIP